MVCINNNAAAYIQLILSSIRIILFCIIVIGTTGKGLSRHAFLLEVTCILTARFIPMIIKIIQLQSRYCKLTLYILCRVSDVLES